MGVFIHRSETVKDKYSMRDGGVEKEVKDDLHGIADKERRCPNAGSLLNVVRGTTPSAQRTRVRSSVAVLDSKGLGGIGRCGMVSKTSKAKGDRRTYKSNWDEPISIQQK